MTKPDPKKPMQTVVSNCWAVRDQKLRGSCRPRYFWVLFYPDAVSLMVGAQRYRPDKNPAPYDGCFHPAPLRAKYNRKTKKWGDTTGAFAGVMRLQAERLDSEVIAHEAIHAALHITRLHDWSITDHLGDANFGDACGEHEEDFAYLVGGIVDILDRRAKEYLSRLEGEK